MKRIAFLAAFATATGAFAHEDDAGKGQLGKVNFANSCSPKLRQIALAWPKCRYPFGSGGKRVTISWYLPEARSASTIWRMKLLAEGKPGLFTPRF